MTNIYFSEREQGLPPRENEEISSRAWGGLTVTINNLYKRDAFSGSFPYGCQDSGVCAGTDAQNFRLALETEIPLLAWPLDPDRVPPAHTVMDLIEFCHEHVSIATEFDYHSYFRHNHYQHDPKGGQRDFREKINRFFAKHGLAYEIQRDGKVIRLLPAAFQQQFESCLKAGEMRLDEMLEDAKRKYLSRDFNTRREALERLWDAWERLKTLDVPDDKRESVNSLLNRVGSETRFRELLETEAKTLTRIGNEFMIRHSETCKIPIDSSAQIDYLFQRMFAMIHLLVGSRSNSPN